MTYLLRVRRSLCVSRWRSPVLSPICVDVVRLERHAYTLFYVLPAAKQEVDAHERLVLSNRDRDLFKSVMENPPELKGKLKSALLQV